ncbi:hypothetical protein SLS53_006331 [Cytospora paraplurivora]|uniref:DUF159 domain protein n=1 Tax=Cytospora paraplurivora TaxID=2898453 RepID=A0AAN9U3J2_9PEZI
MPSHWYVPAQSQQDVLKPTYHTQRPSQVRQMLQDDDMPVADAPADEGDGAPRQSYNFAPGYHGIVYRADVPDWGAGPHREAKSAKGAKSTAGETVSEPEAVRAHDDTTVAGTDSAEKGDGETRYKLQSMKWGLIPFWTKRNPDYAAVMKTINCRDDSLSQAGGMWSSMKGRKRCIVVAQGFYEWLKSGKEKVPHFVKRKDGRLMCFAGLWDCVQYEDSNKQLKFLHDRMPVILDPASEKLKAWLDPSRYEWSKELQDCLKPFDGELEVYPVSKEVGKVGNNSPNFIIPVASKENKSNIANFFANAKPKKDAKPEVEVKMEDDEKHEAKETMSLDAVADKADDGGMGVSPSAGTKRKYDGDPEEDEGPPKKKDHAFPPVKTETSSSPSKLVSKGSKTISATSNGTRSPTKGKSRGTPKITKFFGNSA